MSIRAISFLCASALFTAMTTEVNAQLVFGSTTTSTSNPCAFYLDVSNNQVTTLWNSAANKKVNGFAADIAIAVDDREANAKSLLAVLALGARGGTALRLTASGDDAPLALDALRDLVAAFD